jgi:hypothetical protein
MLTALNARPNSFAARTRSHLWTRRGSRASAKGKFRPDLNERDGTEKTESMLSERQLLYRG